MLSAAKFSTLARNLSRALTPQPVPKHSLVQASREEGCRLPVPACQVIAATQPGSRARPFTTKKKQPGAQRHRWLVEACGARKRHGQGAGGRAGPAPARRSLRSLPSFQASGFRQRAGNPRQRSGTASRKMTVSPRGLRERVERLRRPPRGPARVGPASQNQT